MKMLKSIGTLLFAATFLFGFAACSDSDSSDSNQNNVVATVSTKGTVSADAVTTTGGVTKAILSASNGTYEFTETNSGSTENIASRVVVDTGKSGTWTFTENGASTAKLSGTYKGDISRFGKAEVKLNLTITKVLSNGELKDVATQQAFDFEATTTEFKAAVPTVSPKSERVPPSGGDTTPTEDETTKTVELPESVGENPFSGKTYAKDEKHTWQFTDSLASYTNTKDSSTETYRYSWDANEKLLYLAYNSYSKGGITYSSISEAEELLNQLDMSEEQKNQILDGIREDFNTIRIYDYTIDESGTITSLNKTKYFDGKLPTTVHFSTETPFVIDYNDALGVIYIRLEDNTLYEFNPKFDNNSFSGTMYEGTWGDKDNENSIGIVSGTYTTSGTGRSGCSIELVFTQLPSSVKGISIGTKYTLTN